MTSAVGETGVESVKVLTKRPNRKGGEVGDGCSSPTGAAGSCFGGRGGVILHLFRMPSSICRVSSVFGFSLRLSRGRAPRRPSVFWSGFVDAHIRLDRNSFGDVGSLPDFFGAASAPRPETISMI